MRYLSLACDYDGTIATLGVVPQSTIDALENLRTSGRRLILVTGRLLEDLFVVFPQYAIFEKIVAENGALLYTPATQEARCSAIPRPANLSTPCASAM